MDRITLLEIDNKLDYYAKDLLYDLNRPLEYAQAVYVVSKFYRICGGYLNPALMRALAEAYRNSKDGRIMKTDLEVILCDNMQSGCHLSNAEVQEPISQRTYVVDDNLIDRSGKPSVNRISTEGTLLTTETPLSHNQFFKHNYQHEDHIVIPMRNSLRHSVINHNGSFYSSNKLRESYETPKKIMSAAPDRINSNFSPSDVSNYKRDAEIHQIPNTPKIYDANNMKDYDSHYTGYTSQQSNYNNEAHCPYEDYNMHAQCDYNLKNNNVLQQRAVDDHERLIEDDFIIREEPRPDRKTTEISDTKVANPPNQESYMHKFLLDSQLDLKKDHMCQEQTGDQHIHEMQAGI